MPGPQSGRRIPERQSKLSSEVQAEISRLQGDMGLPREVALRIARKEITVNDALQEMATRDKAVNLMRQHSLDHALASQIAQGHASLGKVLHSRRLASHLAMYSDRSVLADALKDGRAWRFALHGRRVVNARVTGLDRYEARLLHEGSGDEQVVHKLQFKLAWRPEEDKLARKGFRWDSQLRGAPREPVLRPQDRFGCSNRRLFDWLEAKTRVGLTTLEGEVVQGTVAWFSRYEVGVSVRGKAEVVCFRHALTRAAERR